MLPRATQSAQDTETSRPSPAMPQRLFPPVSRRELTGALSSPAMQVKNLLRSNQGALARRVPAIRSELDQRKDLERRVRKRIAPYKNYTEVLPPFSFPEMIVMGIVCSSWNRGVPGLHYWIMQNFGYYRNLAMMYESGYGGERDMRRAANVHLDFASAFSDLDLPIFRPKFQGPREDEEVTYEVFSSGRWAAGPVATVSQFLRPCLLEESNSRSPFRLMDLPAELRLRIYEYALLLPKSGVQVSHKGPGGFAGLHAFSRDYNRPPTRVSAYGPDRGARLPSRLKCPAPAVHLALFAVSKAVYKEAMPVFYGGNLFVCEDVQDLYRLLSRLREHCLHHLRHITFSITKRCKPMATKAFKLLATLPRLKELDIWIHEPSFSTEGNGYVGLSGFLLPGFPQLRRVRGLKAVRFHGDCPTVTSVLGKEMLQPKKEKKKAVVRKRKAVSLTGTKAKKAKLT